MNAFDHEQLVVRVGPRSGLTMVVAIHSTARGPAAGGCRLWSYAQWGDAVTDALRLSAAMSLKCAAAELPLGGGKSVIQLPPSGTLEDQRRRDAFLDFGDLVDQFGGAYLTGEDVGTSTDDMWVAHERTQWALCLPPQHGGSGEPSEPTATGVFSAIEAVCDRLYGSTDLSDRRFTVVGLGQVGGRLARRLAERGAQLIVSDIDPTKRALAAELGAQFLDPDAALLASTDVLVPAALGGVLSSTSAPNLQCQAIVGPANNQLAEDSVAATLMARGILWAPDFIVNAGGAIHGSIVDIGGGSIAEAISEAGRIGDRLNDVLDDAASTGTTPLEAALAYARTRLEVLPAAHIG